MEGTASTPDALTLSMFDSLLELHKLGIPKCEVWLRSYIPRGQVYKVPLENVALKCLVPFTKGVEEVYLMNEDDLTNDIMEMLRGVNVHVFDAHGSRLL